MQKREREGQRASTRASECECNIGQRIPRQGQTAATLAGTKVEESALGSALRIQGPGCSWLRQEMASTC